MIRRTPGRRPEPSKDEGARAMAQRQFREATDVVADEMGVSLRAIAEGLNVDPAMVTNWRKEGGPYPPRDSWRVELAAFVRELTAQRRRQAAAGDRLAADLDPEGSVR